MKNFVKHSFVATLMVLAMAGYTLAADNDNHTVTVNVVAINELAVTGGDITLEINSATTIGDDPDPATDATCGLLWTTNELGKKVTAATSLAAPTYELAVEATGISDASTSAGSVVLTDTAQDFVTGVATTTGGCTLSYTATAQASDGIGTDIHIITYTIVDAA